MKYTIAIALFIAPFYMVLSSMPAYAATPNQRCAALASSTESAALMYQANTSIREMRQGALKIFSEDDGQISKAESVVIEFTALIMRKLYTGQIYMPQVGASLPKMARRLAKKLSNQAYAECMERVSL